MRLGCSLKQTNAHLPKIFVQRLLQIVVLLGFICGQAFGQRVVVEGVITNLHGHPINGVNIAVETTQTGAFSDTTGFFRMELPAGVYHLIFTHVSYTPQRIRVVLAQGELLRIPVVLESAIMELPDVVVRQAIDFPTGMQRLDPRHLRALPGPTRGVESLIKTLPGVFSRSELSHQYSVRGGNFDENLIYVNGIEIYRPFLIRAGQQEGLSFLNSDLVQSIRFSAGGFEARFGDKMSSALDIEYRRPESFAGSFTMSLLEGSLHLEGISKNRRSTFLMGLRHKSNQYLLGTLDTRGDYSPSFSDFQGLFTHQFNPRLQISLLGNYNRNNYLFQPEEQTTRFGTATDVRQLNVVFDGAEINRFATAMGALSLQYQPGQNTRLRWNFSLFHSDESETFDVLGRYLVSRIETDFGRDDFGQPVGEPLGVGTFLRHARNRLNALVWNVGHQGQWTGPRHALLWGIRYQNESITDRINEWTMIDSSGFSLPRKPYHLILMQDTLFARLNMQSARFSGFVQNTWNFQPSIGRFSLIAGLRLNHWSFNRQTLLSPRATLVFVPAQFPAWSFRASAGFFHQPPFYRELRDFQGRLNPNIRAQESIHFVLASEYHFQAWGRPFKYTTEIYFKDLNHLIPYQIDNLRIRYYASNNAHGYAAGVDFKLHGEFVPGLESWASMSLMKTQEQILDGIYGDDPENPFPDGFIPRPTDQRFNFTLFFQDFLPRNPTYKVHLAFFYSTGTPFGPPNGGQNRNALRMSPYRRVDIGFSKQLMGPDSRHTPQSFFRHFDNLWISAEVFNLLQINNTISYHWIQDVENRLFAVPNYLTRRLINLKLVAQF